MVLIIGFGVKGLGLVYTENCTRSKCTSSTYTNKHSNMVIVLPVVIRLTMIEIIGTLSLDMVSLVMVGLLEIQNQHERQRMVRRACNPASCILQTSLRV